MRKYREIRGIAAAENPEMDAALECVRSIPAESCISTATEAYGLKRYEALLGITPENGDTIAQQRERVLRAWNGEAVTIRWLEQTFQDMFEDKVTVKMPEAYTLALTVHGMASSELKTLEQIMQNRIPANIAYTISGDTQTSSEGTVYYAGAVVNTIQYTIGEN